jgi:hypothetical protein
MRAAQVPLTKQQHDNISEDTYEAFNRVYVAGILVAKQGNHPYFSYRSLQLFDGLLLVLIVPKVLTSIGNPEFPIGLTVETRFIASEFAVFLGLYGAPSKDAVNRVSTAHKSFANLPMENVQKFLGQLIITMRLCFVATGGNHYITAFSVLVNNLGGCVALIHPT